jgi:hypothetical protein
MSERLYKKRTYKLWAIAFNFCAMIPFVMIEQTGRFLVRLSELLTESWMYILPVPYKEECVPWEQLSKRQQRAWQRQEENRKTIRG